MSEDKFRLYKSNLFKDALFCDLLCLLPTLISSERLIKRLDKKYQYYKGIAETNN